MTDFEQAVLDRLDQIYEALLYTRAALYIVVGVLLAMGVFRWRN